MTPASGVAGKGGEAADPCPRQRMLLVEDQADLRTVLSDYLTLEDYRVIPAADGLHALQLAAQVLPGLVLLDLAMPGLDGLEVCR
ncbi:MAG: response regulator [Ktedonobacterales bacterium]